MNWIDFLLLVVSIGGLNVLMYGVFRRFFLHSENGALKFFGINLLKDLIWALIWVAVLESGAKEFLVLIGVFLVASFFLYSKVIRSLNKL